MLTAFQDDKKRQNSNNADDTKQVKMSTQDKSADIEGLGETNVFPNLPLLNTAGESVKLHNMIKRRTLLVFQPGTSHTDQWKDRADDLILWKTIPGAAGCTDQLNNYVKHAPEFDDAETDIILILSNKTAANLQDIKDKKNVPFQIFSLSAEAVAMLQEKKHPFFEFQTQLYAKRETFLLNEDNSIRKVMERQQDTPDQCKDEAKRTLEATKKCSNRLG